jgi:hypothetical protein
MNKLSRVIAIGAVLAATMIAQRPFGVLTSSTPPDPATVVANQVARLTQRLTLTAAQATQATTIFTNALTAVTPLETTLNTDWTSLQAAVKSNSTATIDTLSASIGTVTGQITAIQNKADAAFYATLSTAQQAILDASGGLGHGGFDGPGRGGPGGH